jgi:hypothetical protein
MGTAGDIRDIRDIGRGDEQDERAGQGALARANMRALREEAKNEGQPRFVEFWFAGPGGTEVARKVHEPIAKTQSGIVRLFMSTLVGIEAVEAVEAGGEVAKKVSVKVDVGDACRDERTLDAVVAWMYGANPDDEDDPWTLGDVVKILRVASYTEIHGLQRRCSKYIKDWTDDWSSVDGSEEDVGYLVELWMMLSALVTDGCTEVYESVRVALARALMQCAVDDPVVVGFLRGCSLENLALLTAGVVCVARSVDLALAWKHTNETSGAGVYGGECSAESSVLGHIPIGDLPGNYLEWVLASGRLSGADERLVRSAMSVRVESCDQVDRPAKRSKRAERSNPEAEFVWAGVFDGKLGAVDAGALAVRRISDTGIRTGLQRGASGASVVDGNVFLFCTGVGYVFQDTGYVYAATRDSWHPYGIVPSFVAGGQFSTVVYGTWIVFVRMADLAAGPSCVAFDVSRCTWLVMPDILTAREWPCVAVVGDSLYVVGGRGGPTTAPSVEPVPTERIRLDLCTGLVDDRCAQWERVGPSLVQYQSSAVVIGTSIYVTGGYSPYPARPAGTRFVSSALTRVDTESGTVEEMSGMLCGRCGHSSFVSSDGQIVVIGGAMPQYRVRASPAERYDFGARKWIPINMPVPRA